MHHRMTRRGHIKAAQVEGIGWARLRLDAHRMRGLIVDHPVFATARDGNSRPSDHGVWGRTAARESSRHRGPQAVNEFTGRHAHIVADAHGFCIEVYFTRTPGSSSRRNHGCQPTTTGKEVSGVD